MFQQKYQTLIFCVMVRKSQVFFPSILFLIPVIHKFLLHQFHQYQQMMQGCVTYDKLCPINKTSRNFKKINHSCVTQLYLIKCQLVKL